jgi:glycosyltransferase involved in cell wall biosynthesis
MNAKVMSEVTPIVLTFNEEANLARTLESLRWAARVVVVDSGSTDSTRQIAAGFSNVEVFTRAFDGFGNQWNFGIRQTGILSDLVMALDADMAVTAQCLSELRTKFLPGGYAGGILPIHWCYFGKPLWGSFCPPQLRLFRRDLVQIGEFGHAHDFKIAGEVYTFKHGVWHEDRKPVERWLQSQASYSRLEDKRLQSGDRLRPRDRVRQSGWMPFLAGSLAFLRAGGPFGGKRALRYAWERVTYESLLAIRVLDRDLANDETRRTRPPLPAERLSVEKTTT